MKLLRTLPAILASFAFAAPAMAADCLDLAASTPLSAAGRLAALHAASSIDGQPTLKVSAQQAGTDGLLMLPLGDFRDGEIRLRLWSELRTDAAPDARGFAGLAFRVAGAGAAFEYFYVRPSNARSSSQVRRNHSLQYASYPGFPWEVLRRQEPERYESYADMGLGEWIGIRALVKDGSAQFYVNGATHPNLVVEDLKLAPVPGAIGLWVGPGTVAHFAELCVMRRPLPQA